MGIEAVHLSFSSFLFLPDVREVSLHIRYQIRIVLFHQADQFLDITVISSNGVQFFLRNLTRQTTICQSDQLISRLSECVVSKIKFPGIHLVRQLSARYEIFRYIYKQLLSIGYNKVVGGRII